MNRKPSQSAKRSKKKAAGILLITPPDAKSGARKFLLMRHPNRWDLPKGHCDDDESFVETALRETEEETGLTRDRIALDPNFRFELRYPVQYKRHGEKTFEKHVVYFLGVIESTFTPHLTEHESFQWFDWQPPHSIQSETIDGLLDAAAKHFDSPHSSSK